MRIWFSVMSGALAMSVVLDAAQVPTFRSSVASVRVDVLVTEDRRVVRGLRASDFEVTDNGVRQVVENALHATVPIDVTLIIDASGSTESIFDDIRRNGQRILELLRPQDRARVLVIETSAYELVPLLTVGERFVLPKERQPGHLSGIHDAVLAGLVSRPDADRRRLVVVLTDGVDTRSITSAQTLDDVARRSDAVLHIVQVRPSAVQVVPRSTSTRSGKRPAFIPFGEKSTGGRFHGSSADSLLGAKPGVNVIETVRAVFEEFRQSYVIQYQPRDVPAGGWHDVVIRVKGVDPSGVRARAGYFGAAQ